MRLLFALAIAIPFTLPISAQAGGLLHRSNLRLIRSGYSYCRPRSDLTRRDSI
jgi:hypothetical protein